MGISPLLSNAESTTYVLCRNKNKKHFLDLKKRKKKQTTLLTITYFLSEESSEYFDLVLGFHFFEYEKKREDRLIITFRKRYETLF